MKIMISNLNRCSIKFLVFLLLFLYSTILLASSETIKNSSNFSVVHNWPSLPKNFQFGSVSGVAVDSHDHIFVFHRANRKWPADGKLSLKPIKKYTIAVIDGGTGRFVQEWGENAFSMPHGITIDDADNVWLTDVGYHQIYKYSPNGKKLMTLGVKAEAGNDNKHFDRPTAVAVTSDGSFYVADGYNNSRIVKFSKEGNFLFQWGNKGDGVGQFNIPHAITIDNRNNIYVADRGNARVQIFDQNGKFLYQWRDKEIGRPFALCLEKDDLIFVADGGDQNSEIPPRSKVTILKTDGSILGSFGSYGNFEGQFMMAHTIAIDHAGSIYVGDVIGARIQKFERTK